MSNAINFSDRTLKQRNDPHQWTQRQGELYDGRRLIEKLTLWVCSRCQRPELLHPKFIRSEDLGVCQPKPTVEMDDEMAAFISNRMAQWRKEQGEKEKS